MPVHRVNGWDGTAQVFCSTFKTYAYVVITGTKMQLEKPGHWTPESKTEGKRQSLGKVAKSLSLDFHLKITPRRDIFWE